MRSKLTLEQLNALTPNEFHKVFENVVECWPEAAIFCSAMLPFKSFESMIIIFENYLQRLSDENKLRILRLHPDLAGKLLDSHQLTEESSFEQACAGLDKLTPEDKNRLTTLNEEYKMKFGFPFVICVREASKFDAILKGVSERVNNTPVQELEIGLGEVKKICRLRILELVNKL
ncbi:2-oxo-4-hydroxy-4-carboxy-5-ureidoimidazoline decarboxylase-like [Ochlerotatus camptorhynchus]|uniref:2-oxo-4-hydroxy-4-carboxy-5-ureidoimidazoline decarboxylase-like n=1 Tax=Ochlerotatus camptorhynchus TaxID=644619 RepID=UPI0031E17FA3